MWLEGGFGSNLPPTISGRGVMRVEVSEGTVIDAKAETVYRILADYRVSHPAILPRRYFGPLTVERGGVGAGTVIAFEVRLGGPARRVRAEITEPEPGRRLVETDLDRGSVTTFEVAPATGAGPRASVTIRTAWDTSGLRGLVERLLAPPMLRRVYREELANLAAAAVAAER